MTDPSMIEIKTLMRDFRQEYDTQLHDLGGWLIGEAFGIPLTGGSRNDPLGVIIMIDEGAPDDLDVSALPTSYREYPVHINRIGRAVLQ